MPAIFRAAHQLLTTLIAPKQTGAYRMRADYSGLIPANLMTLPHFPASSSNSLAKSDGLIAIAALPSSVSSRFHSGIGKNSVYLIVQFGDYF
jgi:hypothetical protein